MSEDIENTMTQRLIPANRQRDPRELPKTPVPTSISGGMTPVQIKYRHPASINTRQIPKQDMAKVRDLEEQCRRFCLSLFFREQNPIRSLGFISAIPGEGKSFVAAVTAQVLAGDSLYPVTLVECNWERPSMHYHFGFSATPGLAEWIRGECVEADIRYPVADNLNVIPAGNGQQDAVRILQRLKQRGILATLARSNGLLIVDLPALTTTSYSLLGASLLDMVAIVTRIGVTPANLLEQTCAELKQVPVAGIILNQVTRKERVL